MTAPQTSDEIALRALDVVRQYADALDASKEGGERGVVAASRVVRAPSRDPLFSESVRAGIEAVCDILADNQLRYDDLLNGRASRLRAGWASVAASSFIAILYLSVPIAALLFRAPWFFLALLPAAAVHWIVLKDPKIIDAFCALWQSWFNSRK